MNIEKLPLQIEIIWHENFLLGKKYAEKLFKIIDRNPDEISQHEIGISVKLNPKLSKTNYKYARKTGVIILIDKNLVLDKTMHKKILDLKEEEDIFYIYISFGASQKLNFPKINSKNIVMVNDLELKELKNNLEIDKFSKEEDKLLEEKYIFNSILEKICSELYCSDGNSKKAKLFISHTKRDNIGEKKAKKLKRLIQETTKTSVFFDKNSIEFGNDIWQEIEEEIKKSETFIVAINTNEYSNSSWCRKEILCAKKNKRPILLIDALTGKQQRSFPYLGNTKVIKLKNSELELFDFYQILIEVYLKAIKYKYKKLLMKKYEKEGEVFINSPELLDLILNSKTKDCIYYPDPPLPIEEIQLFEVFNKKLLTPFQKMVEASVIKNKNIMISISENNEISELQIKSFISDLIRYLIAFDFNILYGGNLKYQKKSLNLMSQIIKVLEFYKKYEEIDSSKKIKNYISYPLKINNEDEFNYINDIEFKIFNPLNLSYEESAKYLFGEAQDSNKVWEKSLQNMRENIVKDSDYIIIAGGKICGFKGKIPGVLEEITYALKYKKPVYLIGGFGGVSKELINFLLKKEVSDEMKKYLKYFDWIIKDIKILNNGLTEEENRILFELESNTQIIKLILKGIKKLNMEG